MNSQDSRALKITITGATGTGKSTLARALAKELSLPYLEENFLELTKVGLHYNQIRAATEKEQLALRQKALQEYKNACFKWLQHREQLYSAHPGYVADRNGFDILLQWTITRIPFDTTATLRQLLAHCQKESRNHDLIVIPPLTEWSLRSGSNESGLARRNSLQDKLHSQSTLIGLIQQFSTGAYLLLRPRPQEHDTTENRMHEILSALRKARQHSA